MGRPFDGGRVHHTTTLCPRTFFASRDLRDSHPDPARNLGSAEVSNVVCPCYPCAKRSRHVVVWTALGFLRAVLCLLAMHCSSTNILSARKVHDDESKTLKRTCNNWTAYDLHPLLLVCVGGKYMRPCVVARVHVPRYCVVENSRNPPLYHIGAAVRAATRALSYCWMRHVPRWLALGTPPALAFLVTSPIPRKTIKDTSRAQQDRPKRLRATLTLLWEL